MQVDFDHARIRRHAEQVEAWIARWLVAFQQHGLLEFGGDGFDRGDQFQVVVELFEWWHEEIQHAIAGFRA